MAFNRARVRAVVAALVVCVGALAAQVAVGTASSPRIVTCDGAKKDVPAAGMRAYQTFFRSFNSSTLATVNAEELNFEVGVRWPLLGCGWDHSTCCLAIGARHLTTHARVGTGTRRRWTGWRRPCLAV